MYALLRAVLSLFGVHPAHDVTGCVVTPKSKHMITWWGTTVVIAIIVLLILRGHATETFEALAAAWLVDVVDMLVRRPEANQDGPAAVPAAS